jgi:siroheme synthase-like protein
MTEARLPRPLYPLFLKLEGERCLVVGGGALAAQKIEDLLTSGAEVRVVTKTAGPEVQALANEGRVALALRPFEDGDVAGCRVVIAATDDEATNRAVHAAGRAANALVNVVDVVPLCDFYTGGVVRRGPLTVVIGTNGASPSLARRLRLHLEDALPDGLGRLGTALGLARPRLLERYPSFKERAKVLDAFVTRHFFSIIDGDKAKDAADRVERELLSE